MAKTAELYRMDMDKHVCPFGLKAKDLLQREGFTVDDHKLRTRAETDAFKEKHDVKTTPQIFIDGRRVGGYDDLRKHFDKPVRDKDAKTYRPVIALFLMAFAMAASLSWLTLGTLFSWRVVEWFVAFGMCLLALQKLQDIESFSSMFLGYDLLAQKWVPYAYIYPFAEAFAGLGMLSGIVPWLVAPVALFAGTVGAISVYKAVYVDKRDLKCACVGGNNNVPLGFVSLTENLAMMAMAIWMLVKLFAL